MDTQKQTYPKISASYVLDILSPYERPMKPDSESWDWWSLTMCPKTYTPICQQEQGLISQHCVTAYQGCLSKKSDLYQ